MGNKNVLILFSGGIDSTGCVHYYKNLGFNVEGLFIDYGHKSVTYEKKAVNKLSAYYGINTKIIEVKTDFTLSNGEIQGRNFFFISLALLNISFTNGIISLGIHSGTSYTDCTKDFVNKSQEIIDIYTFGKIQINCPFIDMTKREIYEYCKINRVPIDLTYSCEIGSKNQPCGKCLTCKDLKLLYEIEN